QRLDTDAGEIVEALGCAPHSHCLPGGNARNFTALLMCYTEALANQSNEESEQVIYHADTCAFTGPITVGLPLMAGYQASGAAPFLRGGPVENPETVATAIRIGNPQSFNHAKAVVRDSNGWFDELTDAEILEAQRLLSMYEGVFVEPESA